MNRNLFDNVVFCLILLVASVAATVFLAISQNIGTSILLATLAIFIFVKLIKLYNKNIRKIKFMFDAIDNNDFTFQYAINHRSSSDKLVNESMNRMIRTLLQAKNKAFKKEKFYEQIINSINTGIIVIDDKGYIIQKNDKALQLFGLPMFTHISQLNKIDKKLAERLSKIQSEDKFNVLLATERGTINLSVKISETKLQNKSVYIVTFNDINSELDENEIDSWIRLTRVLTHEIMNSVTPIKSISDTLLSKMQGNEKEELRNGLEVISNTGRGLITFIDSYRKFTHIPTPQPTLFYVKKFIERMVHLSCHQNDYTNISWQTEIQPADLILYTDEDLISLVLLNLLKNAMQAIGHEKTDGKIIVKASCGETESVVIEVANNGAPIPESEVAHIFVPFFTTKKNGSGIGLSVSRQIMRLSGGSITLKSNSKSEWTSFVLLFP